MPHILPASSPRAVRPAETDTEMTHMVMPNDANHLGTAFGGRVMEWVDIAGAIAASRLCRRPVVLAELDQMTFWHPIKVGHIALLLARVNFVGTSSMEVGVKVLSEDPLTGERRQTSTAYLTYVALDTSGSKLTLPQLALETDDDLRRHAAAQERRAQRLSRREADNTRKLRALSPTPSLTSSSGQEPAEAAGEGRG
jgi:acyl-CoA hydrolase